MNTKNLSLSLIVFFMLALTDKANANAGSTVWIEPNLGQTQSQYEFIVRAKDLTALVATDHIDFSLVQAPIKPAKMASNEPDQHPPEQNSITRVQMKLVGANIAAEAIRGQSTGAVTNYFKGSDSAQWHSKVPHLRDARIREVYPGIDLVYRLNQNHFEYDFEVKPNADASQIQLQITGSQELLIDGQGRWVTSTELGEFVQQAPVVFQVFDGERREIAGEFSPQSDGLMSFKVDAHDPERLLVIDPVIEFSGYVGGSGGEFGAELLENSSGNYVVLGATSSIDFPGTIPSQLVGEQDVFVAELNASDGSLNWVTIIGGSSFDQVDNMELDSAGNIILAGYSSSSDYPTLNAFQTTFVGNEDPIGWDNFNWDAIITKISPDGSSIVFSTYMGGLDLALISPIQKLGFEWFRGIAIDDNDDIIVVGQTSAADFPVTTTINGRACMETEALALSVFISDISIAKFAADGTRIMSACIGGSERDGGRDVQIDQDGRVYIAGFARSPELPGTAGFYQEQPLETLLYGPFVMKMDADLMGIEFATYVGSGILQRIAIDGNGDIYGSAQSQGLFPVTAGAFQTEPGSPSSDPFDQLDAIVFKLSGDGLSLLYGTYLAGESDDFSSAIKVDDGGRAYVTGTTESIDFPLRDGIYEEVGAIFGGVSSVFTDSNINNIERDVFFGNTGSPTVTYIAKDGFNQVAFSDDPSEIGTPDDLELFADNTAVIRAFDLDQDGLDRELFVGNTDADNRLYVYVSGDEQFFYAVNLGLINTDTRDAVSFVSNTGFNDSLAVANFGQTNEVFREGASNSVAVGRVDGNTTAVAYGGLGSDFSIVFGNENQDVRAYPIISGIDIGPPIIIVDNANAVTDVAIGDLDGDGDNDVVIANSDAPIQIVYYELGLPTAPVFLGQTGLSTNSVLLIDPDLDGDLDLLLGKTGDDMFLENVDGVFIQETRYTGYSGETLSQSARQDCVQCADVMIATDSGIDQLLSFRPTIFLSVLNADGSDLEFSTLLTGEGNDSIFRGLEFANNSDSKVLIAANTNGAAWPKVNTSSELAGGNDTTYIVLELDQDDDGVLDNLDNCSLVANENQLDTNGDGFGNACDADLNNDGIVNFLDVSLFAAVFLTDAADADFNGDGIVNFLDFSVLSSSFLMPPGPGADN